VDCRLTIADYGNYADASAQFRQSSICNLQSAMVSRQQ